MFGDYNQPGLYWCFPANNPPNIDVLLSHISVSYSTLLDGFNLHGLTQINSLVNRNRRLLDLVLANDCALLDTVISPPIDPLVNLNADHPALTVTLRLSDPIVLMPPSKSALLDFRRTDYATLSDLLTVTD